MLRRQYVLCAMGFIAAGFLISGMFAAPQPSAAMPTFAQAYGVSCSTCHVAVPLLNAYGRYVQRTGYASLDRAVLARALPVWIGEQMNYDSTNSSGIPATVGNGIARYSFGNFAVHGVGYLAPDLTFHAQQWITQGENSGGVDTLWVTYNNLLHRDGHLFVGKILNPAPSPYGQDFELSGASASSTVVGDHDWAATYNNRWGARLAYVRKALDIEAGYYLGSADLNGINDFGVRRDATGGSPVLTAGDKTFEWKVAYARADFPLEFGVFGSNGTLPLSTTTGSDVYQSVAGYVQVDPGRYGRPGVFGVYQRERDANPGIDPNSGNAMPATASRGASLELYETILRGGATVGYRHDFTDNGSGTLSNGNAINLGFNIPHFPYAHGYVEANLGGNSAFAGAGGGPSWLGEFWLTLPIRAVH